MATNLLGLSNTTPPSLLRKPRGCSDEPFTALPVSGFARDRKVVVQELTSQASHTWHRVDDHNAHFDDLFLQSRNHERIAIPAVRVTAVEQE
jgi:hypothetical protein